MDAHIDAAVETVQKSCCDALGAHSKAFFENAIASEWRSHAAGIVRTGDLLNQAKSELDRDVFRALKLPFDLRAGQMLRRIASHPFISDPANHGSLPPCWRTLYELTKVPDDVLEAARLDGRLHPGLQRKDVRTVILFLSPREARKRNDQADPVATVLAGLRGLTDKQLTTVWTALTLKPFLRTISADMRAELVGRLMRLRPDSKADGPVLLRESEMLRSAIGQIRIASSLETTPAATERAETQAIVALRVLATALSDVDVDCVTIISKHAKETRCAKGRAKEKKRRAA
jgi:hypothetical protein